MAAAAAATLFATGAHASGTDGAGSRIISVVATRCGTSTSALDAVLRALELELAAFGLEPRRGVAPGDGALARVRLVIPGCTLSGDAVSLEITDTAQRSVVRRSLSLEGVAEPARARTLALVIAEAVRPLASRDASAGAGPRSSSEPSNRAGSATGGAVTPMEDREQDSKLRVGAATRVASLSLNTDVFLGLELNSRARLSEHVALSVEGSYLSGDIEALDDTFVLDFSSWNLAAGVDFVAPGVPTVSLGPRISLTALTVGDARSGQGASPGRISRMAGFLGARGALNVPLGEAVTLDASLEAHHATLRALPTVQTSRAPVGGSTEAFLPSGGFETRSFGLGRWLLALGIGVGFRL